MIRPFRSETERYGGILQTGEFVYDRPFSGVVNVPDPTWP